MKVRDKSFLMAIFVGVMIPGMILSVAEKLYPITSTESTVSASEVTEQNQIIENSQAKDRVLVLEESGAIREMDMNTYLTGVLLGEMPANFHEEALKAQAVVARTYAQKVMLSSRKHPQSAICTQSSCCQAYCSPSDYMQAGGNKEIIDKFQSAVFSTTGCILTYRGELIEATYFSCSGGKTEDAVAVWGTQIPYLQAVDSPGEENATHYQDYVEFSASEFASCLGVELLGASNTWFGNVTYTPGGGVDTIVIAGKTFRGLELRQRLGLNSTAFSIIGVGNTIHIYTKGFGHRVGMSQYGAEAMAVSGSDYEQILAHYYCGTELVSYLD